MSNTIHTFTQIKQLRTFWHWFNSFFFCGLFVFVLKFIFNMYFFFRLHLVDNRCKYIRLFWAKRSPQWVFLWRVELQLNAAIARRLIQLYIHLPLVKLFSKYPLLQLPNELSSISLGRLYWETTNIINAEVSLYFIRF